jgi:ssDNA-binding Zn-finger/Zn-ribbon topoisomerase 1
VKWHSGKHSVLVVKVNPKEASTTCPVCGSKLISNGYRKIRCSNYGFEGDRDATAVLNIEKKTLEKMGASTGPADCPADDRCKPGIDAGNPRTTLQGGEKVSCFILVNMIYGNIIDLYALERIIYSRW